MLHYNVIRNNFKLIFCIIILFFGHDSVRAMGVTRGTLSHFIKYLCGENLDHGESLYMLIRNNASGHKGMLLGVGGLSAAAIAGPFCLLVPKNTTNFLMTGVFMGFYLFDCFFGSKSNSGGLKDPNMPTMKNFIECGQVMAALIMATNTFFRK